MTTAGLMRGSIFALAAIAAASTAFAQTYPDRPVKVIVPYAAGGNTDAIARLIAARLSARLGEGMVNGLLTARLGLLAMDVVRPLPFDALPRPALNDLAGSLLRAPESGAAPLEKGRSQPPTGV